MYCITMYNVLHPSIAFSQTKHMVVRIRMCATNYKPVNLAVFKFVINALIDLHLMRTAVCRRTNKRNSFFRSLWWLLSQKHRCSIVSWDIGEVKHQSKGKMLTQYVYSTCHFTAQLETSVILADAPETQWKKVVVIRCLQYEAFRNKTSTSNRNCSSQDQIVFPLWMCQAGQILYFLLWNAISNGL